MRAFADGRSISYDVPWKPMGAETRRRCVGDPLWYNLSRLIEDQYNGEEEARLRSGFIGLQSRERYFGDVVMDLHDGSWHRDC